MSTFSGKQYKGAARDAKVRRREEALERDTHTLPRNRSLKTPGARLLAAIFGALTPDEKELMKAGVSPYFMGDSGIISTQDGGKK